MLFKNGEKFTLTDSQKKELKRLVGGRFPAKIVYPSSRMTWNKDNNSYDKPASIKAPYNVVIHSAKEGSYELRYSENFNIVDGNTIYSSSDYECKGSDPFTEDRIDELWFLIQSPYCENGPNSKQVKIHKYKFDNEVKAASEYVQNKKDAAYVFEKLFSDDPNKRLSRTQLDRIAKSMNVANIEIYSDDEVRQMIDVAIDKKGKGGPSWFIKVIEDNDVLNLKVLIQDAIDTEAVRIWTPNNKKGERCWRWQNKKSGQLGDKICSVTVEGDFESLYAAADRSKSLQKALEEAVAIKKEESEKEEVES